MKDIRVLVRVIHWEDQIYRLLKKKKIVGHPVCHVGLWFPD